MKNTPILEPHQLDFYESTLNFLSEGIVWTDSQGHIVFSNEAANRHNILFNSEIYQNFDQKTA